MKAEVLDYIRDVNKFSEDLFVSHANLLARKNIQRRNELLRLIRLDLDKLTHALLEVQHNRAVPVLRDFFGDSLNEEWVGAMLAEEAIYHVGFEIHEPMGLVLHGIYHWIEQSKQALGVSMRVKEYMRFPASPAFQGRVGAYTEIMRIWLQVDERTLMLELFDIHRPADPVLSSELKLTHRNFHGLFRKEDLTTGHQQRLETLFAKDPIWHYALHVKNPDCVSKLHQEWQALAAEDSSYFLPYTAPVHNRYDDSYHTKLVRMHPGGRRLELEFVTKYGAERRVSVAQA